MSHINGTANGHALTADQPLKNLTTEALHDNPSGADGTLRRLKLTPASAVQLRPVRWLWDDRIPAGALTLVPGREGIGKSLLMAWLTAKLTRGELPGIHLGTPRPVIYAATEDSWEHTIGPRLYAAGADLDMVFQVEVERVGSFDQLTLPRDCDELAAAIREMGVAMLAADPLLSLISASINNNADRELRTALEPLVRMADQSACAVVGLAHFNKSASNDASNLIMGSRAWSAVARAVISLARDPQADDGSCVLSQTKNNLGRLDIPSLRYVIRTAEVPTVEGEPAHVGVLDITGESTRSVADILAEGTGDPGERAERNEAAEWIRAFLASNGGTAPFPDVLKAAQEEGIAERTLKRARTRAGAISERSGFPAKTVWRLPDSDAPSPATPVGPQPGQSGQLPERGPTGLTVARLDAIAHGTSPVSQHQTTFSDLSEETPK